MQPLQVASANFIPQRGAAAHCVSPLHAESHSLQEQNAIWLWYGPTPYGNCATHAF